MAYLKITPAMAQRFMHARSLGTYDRKVARKALMREIHQAFPGLGNAKLKFFVENPDNPMYCVIRNKRTDEPFDDGQPDAPAVELQSDDLFADAAPVIAKAKAKAKKPAVKAKKPVAKAKPAAKPSKAPAKAKAPTAKPAKAKAKATPAPKVEKPAAASYPRAVRVTLDGQRRRLGTAKSAAEERLMIAKARQA